MYASNKSPDRTEESGQNRRTGEQERMQGNQTKKETW